MSELDKFKEDCMARLKSGKFKDVVQLCQQRLKLHPDDLEALLFISEARLRSGEIGEALNYLGPLNSRLMFLLRSFALLGDAYSGQGQHEHAKEFYRKFLALDPESDLAGEVRSKVESGKPDREEDDISKPGFRTATMAELLMKQGHLEAARDILDELFNNDPSNPEIKEKLAAIRAEDEAGPLPGNMEIIKELEKWQKNLVRSKPQS